MSDNSKTIWAWENDCGEISMTTDEDRARNLAADYNGRACFRTVPGGIWTFIEPSAPPSSVRLLPDNIEKLLAEAKRWAGGSTVSPVGANCVQDLVDALRTAVSAQQEAEASQQRWQQDSDTWVFRASRLKAERDALQQRIDKAIVIADDSSLSSYERHNAMRSVLTALTEEAKL